MPSYSNYSSEELRLADYDSGRLPRHCGPSGPESFTGGGFDRTQDETLVLSQEPISSDSNGCSRSGSSGSGLSSIFVLLPKSSDPGSEMDVSGPSPIRKLKYFRFQVRVAGTSLI